MLHPNFTEILEYIGENYFPNRINNIEVYSNAVIIPNKKTIELMKKYNVIYRFTDYHGHSGVQKIETIEKLMKDNDLEYDHANLVSWYDSGYPQESNGIEGEENLIDFCTACDRKSCHDLWENKLFTCGMCISAAWIDYCSFDELDYFSLVPYDENKRMEFIEFYLGYSEKGYYNYCKKCNGGMNNNTHAIPVGEQMK